MAECDVTKVSVRLFPDGRMELNPRAVTTRTGRKRHRQQTLSYFKRTLELMLRTPLGVRTRRVTILHTHTRTLPVNLRSRSHCQTYLTCRL